MQRREFSQRLAGLSAATLAGLAAPLALAQRVSFKEGSDFVRLPRPVPTESPAGQVEVVEFFAYSCIHCFHFEPVFNEWLKRKPAHVNVRRMPVAFNQGFVPLQRLYFSLEVMGLVDRLHEKVFKAFHEERLALQSAPAIMAWMEKQGVNKDAFASAFNGPAAKMGEKAIALQDAYMVEGTPSLGVAGQFYVSGQGPRTLLIADSLIAQSRKG
jgi:protein dithiol oxidoreductase (disulfide-forming)